MENTFDSASIEKEFKNIRQISGGDFDSSIFKRNMESSKLVLFKHPDAAKNLDLEVKFDKFAKSQENIISHSMSGLNEPEEFKPPSKLPSIVLFKSEGPEIVSKDIDRMQLLQSFDSSNNKIDQETFDKIMKEFIKKSLA